MTESALLGSIRVAVCGARGKMGREVVKTVLNEPGLTLVGMVDLHSDGETLAQAFPDFTRHASSRLTFDRDLKTMLQREKPDACVDFTHPEAVFENTMALIESGCRPVIGTTGLKPEQIEQIRQTLAARELGGIIAPNFAIGAVLMMKFAQEAARYFDHAEIIELHHNRKADAPSGTAIKTAELMQAAKTRFGADNGPETETYPGARGGTGPADIHIHSVRLPGLVAHQEVLFGGPGQTLSIRHDSLDRSSFMPGVALAVKKVMTLDSLIYGLEHLL